MRLVGQKLIWHLALMACLVAGCSKKESPFRGQAVIDAFQMTQTATSVYEFRDGIGTLIRVDLNEPHIFYTQCPAPLSEGFEFADAVELGQRRDKFLETAFPTWSGANASFIQIWNALEHSTFKEVTMPYNGIVIYADTWMEGCRSMTIRLK